MISKSIISILAIIVTWLIFGDLFLKVFDSFSLEKEQVHQIRNIKKLSDSDLPSFENTNYKKFCLTEWTRRGVVDKKMYNYCLKKGLEAYKNLKYNFNNYMGQQWFSDVFFYNLNSYKKRDIINLTLLDFLIKREIEHKKDIEYFMKQPDFNQRKMNNCFRHWYPQLNMIVYCYKND